MLRTFCAASNFNALLHRHEDMPSVQKFTSFIAKPREDRSRDGLAGIMTDGLQTISALQCGKRESIELPPQAKQALESYFSCESLPKLDCQVGYIVNKVQFKIQLKSIRDSTIFFCDESAHNSLSPGSLLYVVSVASPTHSVQKPPKLLCIVRRFPPAPTSVCSKAITAHPNFGANLYDILSDSPWIVIPSKDIICHSISQEWTKGVMVLKPLDRVRNFYLGYISMLTYPGRILRD